MLTGKFFCSSVILYRLLRMTAAWGVALDLDDDAHAAAVGLVPQVRDAQQLLVADEVGDVITRAAWPC